MAEDGSRTPEQGQPPGSERRQAPRQISSLRVTCYPAGSGFSERRQARVRNVSRSGVAVSVDRRWDPGTALMIELPAAEGTATVRARVVHATQQLGGTFLIGCVLEIPLTDAQIQSLTS